ncbi:DUF397 domain-containing protein [Saccharopolyspora sp. ASAGF58]|uniref:DUF397 domain-containing protein n=1 Tax=Saccharopolyspora sp. ASAGF58 TaxID=2719023 RepID=UPI00143FF89D|nr:DUF397 domain-containing protein [Saccharopolyspora sp. ASAGF58]QIZ34233.1 DUF397 domain-containing protein [Saccharopolyspora sp. ASAGF58]
MTENNRLQWRKSSYSGGAQTCVEVARFDVDHGALRDSKLGDASPILVVGVGTFTNFVTAVKTGRFDG